MSAWFAAALLVCGLVRAQSLPGGSEGDLTSNDGYEAEDTSLQQLTDRAITLERSTRRRAGSPAVAFSTVLTDFGTKWCLNSHSNICTGIRRVIANIGEAYDPDTGVFTAPVKGLYYFQLNSRSSDVALLKNGRAVDDIYNTRGSLSSASNGVTLVLEPGDQMSITTSANRSFRGSDGLSTFSGFLISSM